MEAERRQVTVLFADMVGFTSFSERSGEEAAYTLMRSLSKLMDDAVHDHGGVVQCFTGDGIMAMAHRSHSRILHSVPAESPVLPSSGSAIIRMTWRG
jgi:class 3 adenylate cyclase